MRIFVSPRSSSKLNSNAYNYPCPYLAPRYAMRTFVSPRSSSKLNSNAYNYPCPYLAPRYGMV